MTQYRVVTQADATTTLTNTLPITADVNGDVISGAGGAASSDIGFFRQFWQSQGTAVQGTWHWTAVPSETDYASVTGEAAGCWNNEATHNNLDEYKWANIYLSAGTYKITLIYFKSTNLGICEILYGTTSLGTVDQYAAVASYNLTATFTLTRTSDTTADLRIRCNGKNAGSSDNVVLFARIHMEKTA